MAWVARRPAVVSTIIGATKLEQLDSNLRALDVAIPAEHDAKLEAATRPSAIHPYIFFDPAMQAMVSGGTTVRSEPQWFRPR